MMSSITSKKIERKREEKKLKEKTLLAYRKQFKGRCNKCIKIWQKSIKLNCPENNNERRANNYFSANENG